MDSLTIELLMVMRGVQAASADGRIQWNDAHTSFAAEQNESLRKAIDAVIRRAEQEEEAVRPRTTTAPTREGRL